MIDSEMENRYLDFKIDFKTAKELNNDLIDLVNAVSDLEMRTAIGKRIRDNFQGTVEKSLEVMEDSVILVLPKEMEW
jgi:hypothetical protein